MGPTRGSRRLQPSVAIIAMPPGLSGYIALTSRKIQFWIAPIAADPTQMSIAPIGPRAPSAKPNEAKIEPETAIDKAKASVHLKVFARCVFSLLIEHPPPSRGFKIVLKLIVTAQPLVGTAPGRHHVIESLGRRAGLCAVTTPVANRSELTLHGPLFDPQDPRH